MIIPTITPSLQNYVHSLAQFENLGGIRAQFENLGELVKNTIFVA